MGLLDILEAAGKGTLGAVGGLLGGVGEIATAAYLPEMYKEQVDLRNYQRDQQARQQWAENMPMQRSAQNLAPGAFDMDEARVSQMLDPKNQMVQPAQATPSWGEMSQYMMQSPDATGRTGGAKILTDQYAPRAQATPLGHGLTNIVRGNQGNAFGIDPQGNQVRLPGATVPPIDRSPLVVNQIGGDNRPKPPVGMQTVRDPATGGWRFIPVAGGKFDPKGSENVLKQTEGYRAKNFQYNNVLDQIDNYAVLQKELGKQLNPYSAEGLSLDQAQTQVLMGLKDALELGVLTGPDERLINKIMPKATGIINFAAITDSEMARLIQRAREGVTRKQGNLKAQYPHATVDEGDGYEYKTINGKKYRKKKGG